MSLSAMETDVLVVGGGLSGLSVAAQLASAGRPFQLIEARERFGGRILSERTEGCHFDMGPTWFWPGHSRIAGLISKLGLTRFDQYYTGELIFEDENGQVQRGRGHASMQGSYRLEGGLSTLTDALAASLPDGTARLNFPISQLEQTADGVVATTSSGETLHAKRVVLALPPRIAAELTFLPALPPKALQRMASIPTWMAGQAKAVAVYETPFWREAGLSGDAMSRYGPMVEVHDASPADGGPYALFGFIGIPPVSRANEQLLRHHLVAQLQRLFGPKALEPQKLFVKDWALDPFTATTLDREPSTAHPNYGLPPALGDPWNEYLLLSGTEFAPQFGGYLEGALEAAEITTARLDTFGF